MNYFEGLPSPIGAILILLPLIYEISDLKQFFNPKILVPYITILVSVMLISKIPTYSFKKIVVPRSASIFLLFGIILYFGLILVYTFNAIVISGLIYMLMVPVSSMHYLMIKKNEKIITNDTDHHEDVL